MSESKWEKTRNSLGMPLCFVSLHFEVQV